MSVAPTGGVVRRAAPSSVTEPSTSRNQVGNQAVVDVPSKQPITDEIRRKARPSFRQALELWSSGRLEEARAMVDLGLLALSRALPDDRVDERPLRLSEDAMISADGRRLVVGDRETIHVSEVNSGELLGLRVHDFGGSLASPGISPKGTYVVATSTEGLTIYKAQNLSPHAVFSTRRAAPFAFLDDEHLVTVRLSDGNAEGTKVALPQHREHIARELPAQSAASRAPEKAPALEHPADSANGELSGERRMPGEQSDDELVVVSLAKGTIDKSFKLTAPPDEGLMRRVASLPPSEACEEGDRCESFAFNPQPIGRRVDSIKVQVGVVSAAWKGGSVSLHRVRDGKLIGSFRPRGENWKPGLVAVVDNPPRAAVITSYSGLGRGIEPPFSVTALIDLRLGRVVELIDDCRWATGVSFSADGKKLVVGDLRKACMHDAKTGRLIDMTEEVRPSKGNADLLQDVEVRPVQDGRWFLRTADGSFGVFDGTSGKALYRGVQDDTTRRYVAADSGALYIVDLSGDKAELVTLGPMRTERRILRAEELEQREFPPEALNTKEGRLAVLLHAVSMRSCLLEGFRLPLELCRVDQGAKAR